jgi:hypothetical protein
MCYSLRDGQKTVEDILGIARQERPSAFLRLLADARDVLTRKKPLVESCRKLWRALSLVYWMQQLQVRMKGRPEPVPWSDLWAINNTLGQTTFRALRTLVLLFQLAVIYWLLVKVTGESEDLPARGWTIFYANGAMEIWSMGIAAFVTFFFVDATRLATAFTECIGSVSVLWDRDTVSRHARELGVDERIAGEYVGIHIIGEYTRSIGWMIMVPATVLFLLVAARSSYLDAWNWPLPLAACLCVLGLYVVAKAIILRRTAERARNGAIARLHIAASGLAGSGAHAKVDQINMLVRRIGKHDQGAFSPWSKNPLLRAMLLPAGGFGVLELLNVLTLF